jgi:chromosome partitioning protein
MVAADAVLVPLQCEFLALEGLSQVTTTINTVSKSLNPKLRLHGIVLTMFDRRNNLSELVEADVRGFFNDQVYNTVIPRNVRISEAPSHGLSVLAYDPKSAGAAAYLLLAEEFTGRDASMMAGAATPAQVVMQP